MPLPIAAVVAAIHAGGTLVPHAAGGLIVSGASGYVAGTYITTAALATMMTGAATGAAAVAGSAIYLGYSTVAGATLGLIGGAGLFGTTIGATGITGMLMKVGILPSTSITTLVMIGVGIFTALLLGVFGVLNARKFRSISQKISSTPEGEEAAFSDGEARFVQKVIMSVARKHSSLWRWLMAFLGRKCSSTA